MGKTTLIINGRLITEIGLIPRGYIAVENGKIISLGSASEAPERADKTIDAGGRYISPGFIDIHTHGIQDVDFMESDEETTEKGFKEYSRYGVTRILATTLSNPLETIIGQIKRIRTTGEQSSIGGMLAGVHVEGPWLAERCRGGHAAEYLRRPVEKDIRLLLGEIGDIIRTVTYAPELENTVWFTEQLARNSIIPVFGHTESGYDDAERCIQSGARHVTHMYDTTLGYKENPDEALVMMPGMETAVMLNDDVSIELIGCPVHVPPPFFKLVNKVKPRDKRIIVTDSLVGTGLPDGTELTYKDGRKVYVEEGVLRMRDDDPRVNGNLTGSAVTMNIALKRLCSYAEIPVEEGVRWCSINPATTLGINGETGSLTIGKYADITLFDDNYDVALTMLKGDVIFEDPILQTS